MTTKQWSVIKAPNAPPPRCAHQVSKRPWSMLLVFSDGCERCLVKKKTILNDSLCDMLHKMDVGKLNRIPSENDQNK